MDADTAGRRNAVRADKIPAGTPSLESRGETAAVVLSPSLAAGSRSVDRPVQASLSASCRSLRQKATCCGKAHKNRLRVVDLPCIPRVFCPVQFMDRTSIFSGEGAIVRTRRGGQIEHLSLR
ncbi:hypothetical protein ABEF93_004034 [Exophiala dermatitidis]